MSTPDPFGDALAAHAEVANDPFGSALADHAATESQPEGASLMTGIRGFATGVGHEAKKMASGMFDMAKMLGGAYAGIPAEQTKVHALLGSAWNVASDFGEAAGGYPGGAEAAGALFR